MDFGQQVAVTARHPQANRAGWLEKTENEACEDRGWCKAEVEWSSLRTLNVQHQRIDGSELDAFNCRVPMTPESFKETMRKAEFTHRSDADAVIQLQEKIFFEKVTACKALVLEGVPASEIEALARALPLYKNMTHLTITKFRCGERAAIFLAEAGKLQRSVASLVVSSS